MNKTSKIINAASEFLGFNKKPFNGFLLKYISLFLIFSACVMAISCNRVELEDNPARLFTKSDRAAAESAVKDAWSDYYAGGFASALEKFAAVIGSGEEEFVLSASIKNGLRCGLGYCLLKSSRLDEALYQFEFEAGGLIESAVGAAYVHFFRREYRECLKKIEPFDKLYYQASPYEQNFRVCGDINLEAHKLIFLANYYMPASERNAAHMKTQYSFIAGRTSENGISEGADKIFLKIINAEANRN